MLGKIETVDEYIEQFQGELKDRLLIVRSLIKSNLPLAHEKMSYGMPTYAYHGNLIHFAMFNHHLGVYPGPDVIEHLKHYLQSYMHSKGAIQFQNKQPLPLDLLIKIIECSMKMRSKYIIKTD